MAVLQFLNGMKGIKASPLANFWQLDRHVIPPYPGVYLLIAKSGISFTYPTGTSAVYYIGQGRSLHRRLHTHYTNTKECREYDDLAFVWKPRYEYGAKLGGRYCFIRTWRGMSPKGLEDRVLERFAKRYHAFPVANSAGAWRWID